ncbi:MAG: serine hydrolase [Fidelibacterota bacterium]
MRTLLTILILTTAIFSQSTMDTKLANIKQKYNLVGMSVAVVRDTSVIFANGYGKRDVNRNLPMKAGTQYRIASISKMISATALMKLYDEGKFQLDDDISDYLGYSFRNPNFPDQKITFRKLMAHTSSIRDGSNYHSFLSDGYNSENPPSIKELFLKGGDYYAADIWANKSPNANYFQYANANYGVVASLVEILSGKRFDQYCREELFASLNMNSDFNVTELDSINNLAVLYRRNGNSWSPQADNYSGSQPEARVLSDYELGSNGFIFGPQGGLRASVLELANFMICHIQNGVFQGRRILSDSTMEQMHKTVWKYTGGNGNNYFGIFKKYALGNHTTTNLLPGISLTGHPGEAYGLISDMYYSKDENFGIIFLTNGGQWGYGDYSGWYNVEEDVFNACYDELANITAIYDDPKIAAEFGIKNIYPNPFNPDTIISFYVNKPETVTLKIYDMQGNEIKILAHKRFNAGYHQVKFHAKELASGLYFCQLITKNFMDSKKIMLLK